MKVKSCIICDLGASNGRVIIGDYDGSSLNFEEIYRFDNIPVKAAETLYWDVLYLYKELKNGVKLSFEKRKEVSSIAIDTWAVDFGFIDKRGKLLGNPVHYRDKERNSMIEALNPIYSQKRLFELTGGLVISIMSIYHMYSLALNKATELYNADKFLMMPDIFNYFLTGEASNEYTNVTTTIMYSINDKKWLNEIFDRLNFPKNIVGDVLYPASKLGSLKKELANELGGYPIPLILPATHDTASAEIGIPVTGEKIWAFVSIGTWSVVGMETGKPIINDEVFLSGFGNEGGADGKSYLAKNVSGLWVIQQCRDRWIKEKKRDISWDEIVELSQKEEEFNAFIDIDDPIFNQLQQDMPKIVSDYVNKKENGKILSSVGEISRCVFESLVMKIYYNIQKLEQLADKNIEFLHVVGGGSKNRLICQWLANLADKPVIAGPPETTSYGNFIVQLKGLGEINDFTEGREIIRSSVDVKVYEPEEVQKWREAYQKIKERFK